MEASYNAPGAGRSTVPESLLYTFWYGLSGWQVWVRGWSGFTVNLNLPKPAFLWGPCKFRLGVFSKNLHKKVGFGGLKVQGLNCIYRAGHYELKP